MNIGTRTVTPAELEKIIYKKGETEPEVRFRSHDDGGVFKLFYPEDVTNPKFADKIHYSLVEQDGEIVAIGKLAKRFYEDNVYELASVSVDPKCQGEGHASRVLDEMFRFAKTKDWTIVSSAYTKEGWEKLKKPLHELARKHGVKLIDPEDRLFRESHPGK